LFVGLLSSTHKAGHTDHHFFDVLEDDPRAEHICPSCLAAANR
jgi:hypothetical protein